MSKETIELIALSHLVVAGILFIAIRKRIASLTYRFQSLLPKPLRAPFSVGFYERAFPLIGVMFLLLALLYLFGW